jgi:hypothetical protein
MRAAAAALALFAWLAQNVLAQDAAAPDTNMGSQNLSLVLPHALAAGETAAIEVQVGPISRGRQVIVTTAAGRPLGTISPFGTRAGQDAGTFTLPVPADAIRDGRVAVRLTITEAGGPPRAPTPQEVRGVKVTVGGAR